MSEESNNLTKEVLRHPFWSMSVEETRAVLRVSDAGLSEEEAMQRLSLFGPNAIDAPERLRAIRARIEQQKTYPSSARREGIEGTTTLAFRIREGGAVEEARVLKSSGSSLLDEASLEAVRRAAPLPPVEGEIRVSLVFQLRSL